MNNEVITLVKMMNCREPLWKKTKERITAVSLGLKSKSNLKIFNEMISDKSEFWTITAERLSAIYTLISDLTLGKLNTINDLISSVITGSSSDNVSSKQWVKDVLSYLISLKENEETPYARPCTNSYK
jgi:hypothetical protein